MGPLLAEAAQSVFELELTLDVSRWMLVGIGLGVGVAMAHFFQEQYQAAYNGWPWLAVSLLVPVGTVLVTAALMLIIGLFIVALTVVLYIIGIAVAIACICGMFNGG